ncbi:hypothetical protein BLX88_25810, partial [Bacillus obstructivus]
GLAVQRVEQRLDQDEVRPALDQRIGLFAVHAFEIIKVDLAETRIVDVGAERQRLVGRSDGPCNKARAAVLGLIFIRQPPREPRALDIDLAHQMLGGIIRLADAVGREGVGLG